MKKPPKKPDRFERMVVKTALGKGENKFFYAGDVVKLLRQEHRWMVRMVQKAGKIYQENCDQSAAMDLLQDILDQLKKRAR